MGERVDKSVCLSMTAGASQPTFFKILEVSQRGSLYYTRGGQEMDSMGTCSRCRGTASSDSSVLEHWGELWTLWCFLPLFSKDGSEW